MQKKLFVKSYGCQMNEYDSAKIADLIVLNTCFIRVKVIIADNDDIVFLNNLVSVYLWK